MTTEDCPTFHLFFFFFFFFSIRIDAAQWQQEQQPISTLRIEALSYIYFQKRLYTRITNTHTRQCRASAAAAAAAKNIYVDGREEETRSGALVGFFLAAWKRVNSYRFRSPPRGYGRHILHSLERAIWKRKKKRREREARRVPL